MTLYFSITAFLQRHGWHLRCILSRESMGREVRTIKTDFGKVLFWIHHCTRIVCVCTVKETRRPDFTIFEMQCSQSA
jgi:hypothetical protein